MNTPLWRELRSIFALALPIMIAQMLQMGMMVMDTIMVGRLSSTDLAGVILGVHITFPLLMLASGVAMGVTPIIAQLNGAGKVPESGAIVRQGLWVVLAGALLMLLVMNTAAPVFSMLDVDPTAIPIAENYLQAYSIGMPALLGYFLLRYFCEGLGRTMPAMLVAACALPLKGALNYVFIYGKFGAPELGGAGCGVASAIVCWFELLAMLFIVRRPFYRVTNLFESWSWPQWHTLKQITAVGLPIGITQFLEMAVFSLVSLLIGKFGAETLAAHGIASNVNGVTYMIPVALGIACTIRVGFYVGAEQLQEARQSAKAAFIAALSFAVLSCTALLLFRTELASLYSTEPAVIAMAANIILFIAAYQFIDDTQVVAMGVLRGFKDTKIPMYIALFGYWLIALPIGCVLAFGWYSSSSEGIGVYGFWWAISLGLLVVALMLYARVRWIFKQPLLSATVRQPNDGNYSQT